jgi:hypothetical protein
MATLETLIENVVSIRKLIGVYLGVPKLNTRQQAALQTDLVRLDKNLAALAAYKPEEQVKVAVAVVGPPVYDHVLTYDEEHVIFINAEDPILESLGRPFGHDGAERGALPLDAHIELAEKLNLPLHLAQFKSFLQPGTAQ